jgi:hypothetical protein
MDDLPNVSHKARNIAKEAANANIDVRNTVSWPL